MRTRPASRQSCPTSPQQRPSIIHSRSTAHDVVCDRQRHEIAEGGRSNQLIGHDDHKPPRNRPLERLPEGAVLAVAHSSHGSGLTRATAPAELVIVDAVAEHDEQADE
jgi:hypothetical protein